MECIDLCISLQVHDDIRDQIVRRNDWEYSIGDAYNMLNAWLLSMPDRPGKALHAALLDVNNIALAEEFEGFLLL